MSIKDTLEQIETTPDNDETGIPTAWFALDDRRITTADFKSLAAYTRQLETAATQYELENKRLQSELDYVRGGTKV